MGTSFALIDDLRREKQITSHNMPGGWSFEIRLAYSYLMANKKNIEHSILYIEFRVAAINQWADCLLWDIFGLQRSILHPARRNMNVSLALDCMVGDGAFRKRSRNANVSHTIFHYYQKPINNSWANIMGQNGNASKKIAKPSAVHMIVYTRIYGAYLCVTNGRHAGCLWHFIILFISKSHRRARHGSVDACG